MDAAAVASAATAVPVHNVGWSPTAIVSSVQTIIITLLGGGGLYGLFKGVGLLWNISNQRAAQDDQADITSRKIASDERAADFDRLRDELSRLLTRIITLEDEVKAANASSMKSQMQMGHLTAAFGLVSAELERKDPGNPVIKAARNLVAQATHEDAFGASIQKLGSVKGVGE